MLDEHDRTAQQIVAQHRGNLVRTTGDGILTTFDGPGRAIRCALALEAAAMHIGLPVRAGLHTGEIELRDDDVGGIAVHAAARVMAQSGPGEVLVSRVVTSGCRPKVLRARGTRVQGPAGTLGAVCGGGLICSRFELYERMADNGRADGGSTPPIRRSNDTMYRCSGIGPSAKRQDAFLRSGRDLKTSVIKL